MVNPMAAEEMRQKTQPKKGEPVEIPVPKRSTIDKLLRKSAQPSATRRPSK